MLLIHIEKDRSFSSYNAFSLLKRRDHTALESCETSIPWNHVRLQGISMIAQREEVERIKSRLGDESVQLGEYKLNRVLLVDSEVMTGSTSTGFRLASLVGAFYHYKKMPEKLDVAEFEEFVQMTRAMTGLETSGRSRQLPGVFTTYDGKIVFAYFLSGKLKFEEITQSAVIENMKVTYLSDMIFAARKDAERRLADRMAEIDTVEKAISGYHFEVVRKLTQGNVLGFTSR